MSEIADLVSIDEVAEMLSIHKSSVHRMVNRGIFTSRRIGADDGSARILKVDVENYVKRKYGLDEVTNVSN